MDMLHGQHMEHACLPPFPTPFTSQPGNPFPVACEGRRRGSTEAAPVQFADSCLWSFTYQFAGSWSAQVQLQHSRSCAVCRQLECAGVFPQEFAGSWGTPANCELLHAWLGGCKVMRDIMTSHGVMMSHMPWSAEHPQYVPEPNQPFPMSSRASSIVGAKAFTDLTKMQIELWICKFLMLGSKVIRKTRAMCDWILASVIFEVSFEVFGCICRQRLYWNLH